MKKETIKKAKQNNMNNNLEFENEDPSPNNIEDNYPRTNYGEGYYKKLEKVAKQETIEELANEYFKLSHSRLINEQQKEYERELFMAGAKFQAEKMYSEEDMRKCWDASKRFERPISEGYAPNFNELIEQFKKK